MALGARAFVLGFLVFGLATTGLAAFTLLGGLIGVALASGCERMAAQVFGMASIALAGIGVLHLAPALMWLRGPLRGCSEVSALCNLSRARDRRARGRTGGEPARSRLGRADGREPRGLARGATRVSARAARR